VCGISEEFWLQGTDTFTLPCRVYSPMQGSATCVGDNRHDILLKTSGHGTGLVRAVDPETGVEQLMITSQPIAGVWQGGDPVIIDIKRLRKYAYDVTGLREVNYENVFAGEQMMVMLLRPSRLKAEDLEDYDIPEIQMPIRLAEYFGNSQVLQNQLLRIASKVIQPLWQRRQLQRQQDGNLNSMLADILERDRLKLLAAYNRVPTGE